MDMDEFNKRFNEALNEGFIKKSNIPVSEAKPAIVKAINNLRVKKKLMPVTRKADIPDLKDYIEDGFKIYSVAGTICAVEIGSDKSVGYVYAFLVNPKYKNNVAANVRAIRINYRKFLGAKG